MQKQILLTHSSRDKDFEEQLAICEEYLNGIQSKSEIKLIEKDNYVGNDSMDKDLIYSSSNSNKRLIGIQDQEILSNNKKNVSFSFIQSIFLWCCKNLGKLSSKIEGDIANINNANAVTGKDGKNTTKGSKINDKNKTLTIDMNEIFGKAERIWIVINKALNCIDSMIFRDELFLGSKNFDSILRSIVIALKSQNQLQLDLSASALMCFSDKLNIRPSIDVLLLMLPICENILSKDYVTNKANPFGLINEIIKIFGIVLTTQQPKRSYEILSSKDMIICLYSIFIQARRYENTNTLQSKIQNLFSQILFHEDHIPEFSLTSSIFKYNINDTDPNDEDAVIESKKKKQQSTTTYAKSIFISLSEILQSPNAPIAAFAISDISLSFIKARLRYAKQHRQISTIYEKRRVGNTCFAFLYEMFEILHESIKGKQKSYEVAIPIMDSMKVLFIYLNQDGDGETNDFVTINIYDPETHEQLLQNWFENLLDQISSVKINSNEDAGFAQSLFSMIISILNLDFRILESRLKEIFSRIFNLFCIDNVSNRESLVIGRKLFLQLLTTYNSLRQISQFLSINELAQSEFDKTTRNEGLENILNDIDMKSNISTQFSLVPEPQIESIWKILESITLNSQLKNKYYEFNAIMFSLFLQAIEITRHNWNSLLKLALSASSKFIKLFEQIEKDKNSLLIEKNDVNNS